MQSSTNSKKSYKRSHSDTNKNKNNNNNNKAFKGVKTNKLDSSQSSKDDDSISSNNSRSQESDSVSTHNTTTSTHSDSSKSLDLGIINDFNNFFDKIISTLRAKLDIKNASDSFEQTTDMESQTTPQKNSKKEHYGGIFGKEESTVKVASKVYIKGFKDNDNKFFYGVALERLPQSQQYRKPWTGLQKQSDSTLSNVNQKQYYLYPDNVKTHKSHALPNYLHGPETSLNMATASTGIKSSIIIGQGDAQGYIERVIGDILDTYKDNQIFDLRWKSTDYFDDNNRLIKRRIKLFALDAHDKKQDAEKFCEVMLGEFYLAGNLAVLSKSNYAGQLRTAVQDFSNACHKYVKTISSSEEDDNPNNRTEAFWHNKGFKSRKRDYSPTCAMSSLQEFDNMPDKDKASFIFPHTSEDNKKSSLNVLKNAKIARENDGLNPRLISKNTNDDISLADKINQAVTQEDNSEIGVHIQNIKQLINTQKNYNLEDELNFFKETHKLFKYLVDSDILIAKDIRQFIPKGVIKNNERIKFHNTPISEVIMAIVRIADSHNKP